MRKRLRILLGASVIATLCCLIWWPATPPEPAYDGKPLSFWLAQQNLHWPGPFWAPPENAIRHIGTNAFPAVTRLLRYRDNAAKAKLRQFLERYPSFPFHIKSQEEFHAQGLAALCALGHDAKPLVPVVAEALDHIDEMQRTAAEFWLASLGSDGAAAVPALIQILNNSTNHDRPSAVSALAAVGVGQAGLVLPVLQRCLTDPNPAVRLQAANEFSRGPWIRSYLDPKTTN